MNKAYKGKGNFIFIIGVSILFIMVITFAAVALTKKSTTNFPEDGYVLSSNKKIDFNSGTSYRLNLNKEIVFTSTEGKEKSVNLDSFIHYKNGDISLLKTGAFVDLGGLTGDIVPYYNITNKSMLKYKNGGYSTKNGSEELYFDNILLRVSENKFLVAGKDVTAKLPGLDKEISGEYFEITYVADGIVLIENQDVSYQVTAAGSSIKVNNIKIDLNTKNVLNGDVVKLNMTQITIDGDENIDITPQEESTGKGGGRGESGESGSGSQSSSSSNSSSNRQSTSSNSESVIESKAVESTSGNVPVIVNDSDVSVELVDITVGNKDMTGIFQVNNQDKILGDLTVTITNVKTKEVITPIFNLTNTGHLSVYTDMLATNSDYTLSIKGTTSKGIEAEYFQRTFATDDYGITLKKVLVTDSDIDYKIIFDNKSKVTEASVYLYGPNNNTIGEEKIVTKTNNEVTFTGLNSNTNYTLKVTNFKIGNTKYSGESVDKKVLTLKKKPTVGIAKVTANDDNSKFVLTIDNVNDEDEAITKYNYYVYEFGKTDEDPIYETSVYSPSLTLRLGENGITGRSNYQYKAVIEYNDNEKIREIETGISEKFYRRGASVTFDFDSNASSFDTIAGTIKLTDPDCNVPMQGRDECENIYADGENNVFRVAYEVDGTRKYQNVTFTKTDEGVYESVDFSITGLRANKEYVLELLGDTYDNGTLYQGVLIGQRFTATTKSQPGLIITSEAGVSSSYEVPMSKTITLDSTSNESDFIDKVGTMKVTLYALDAAGNKKQIGEEGKSKILSKSDIRALYKNEYLMSNSTFGIANIGVLKDLITDSVGWLYSNYVLVFSDAYYLDGDGNVVGDAFRIENPEVKLSIDKSYLLAYYAQEREATNVTLTEIKNSALGSNAIDGLDKTTIVAYTINADLYVGDILDQYYGKIEGANNWNYIYYIYDYSGENILYTSEPQKNVSHTFYLDDENMPDFRRGNSYQFGFQIELEDGKHYPETPIKAKYNESDYPYTVNPLKQIPIISYVEWDSTADSLTFKYKVVKDVDNAYAENKIYAYLGDEMISSADIEKSDEYKTFTLGNLTKDKQYSFKYQIKNVGKDGVESSTIGQKGLFNFYGDTNPNAEFTLDYSDIGSKLEIEINDTDMLSMGAAYEVTIKKSDSSTSKKFMFEKTDLTQCSNSNNKCLSIDYADIEDYQGSNNKISVKAYYENGVQGINSQSDYHVIHINPQKIQNPRKYLKVRNNNGTCSGIFNQTTDVPTILVYNLLEENEKISIKEALANGKINANNENCVVEIPYRISSSISVLNETIAVKTIKEKNLTSQDNNFNFSGIIPSVTVVSTSRNINSIGTTIKLNGLSETIVNNEFESNDKKITVEVYDDNTFSNVVATLSKEINLNGNMTFTFNELLPDHTYFYKVYGNIKDKNNNYTKTELYDNDNGTYVIKSISTYNKDDILNSSNGIETNFVSGGNDSEDYDTRRGVITTNIKPSCDISNLKIKYELIKTSDNTKLPITGLTDEMITVTDRTYSLNATLPSDFLFGGIQYKLKVTAVSSSGAIELYNSYFKPINNTTGSKAAGTEYVGEPDFEISDVILGTKDGKYTLTFTVNSVDYDRVLMDKNFYLYLTDSSNNIVTPTDENSIVEANKIKINVGNDGTVSKTIVYEGLDMYTLFSIRISAKIRRNNSDLSEKIYTYDPQNMENSVINTGGEYNVSIGSGGTLSTNGNQLIVTYNNAVNLRNITKIEYQIYINNVADGNATIITEGTNTFRQDTLTKKWYLTLDTNNVFNPSDNVLIYIKYYAKSITDEREAVIGYIPYSNNN